jgi:hypothetical protein
MLAAVLLAPGTWLDAERQVDGDDNWGRIDYSVLKDDQLLCVCEAKESNINAGFAVSLKLL